MYRDPNASKIRCFGYLLMSLSFLYYFLEPMIRRIEYHFLGITTVQNSTFMFASTLVYLALLIGATLMNYHSKNKASFVAMAITFFMGISYPIHGFYSITHTNIIFSSALYNTYAVAVLFAIAFSMFHEKKPYRILPLLLFVIWFFFTNYIAMSRLYFFIGIATLLTDMVALLMTFYYALEFILEKSTQKSLS